MDIPTTTQPSAAAPPSTTASGRKISSDFDTFLKMLTTQIQNQDPLNPMESTEFAVQLATFSGVEQQTRTNQMLEQLSGQLGVMNMAQLAGWIGMEARVAAPAQFGGFPIALDVSPEAVADRAVLVVTDAAGHEVMRQQTPVSGGLQQWEGRDTLGGMLPHGRYSFSVESFSGQTLIKSAPVETYQIVREARAGAGGQIDIVFDGGVTAASASVAALRQPG